MFNEPGGGDSPVFLCLLFDGLLFSRLGSGFFLGLVEVVGHCGSETGSPIMARPMARK